jgi:hypothetical protein
VNINLLRAIHSSRLRINPAVKQQASNNMHREYFMPYLRILAPLGEIPLSVPGSYNWYLDGRTHPQSNTGISFRELIEAGVSRESIWHRSQRDSWQYIVLKVFRICCRLPQMLILLVCRFSIQKKHDLVALQILLAIRVCLMPIPI